MYDKLLALDSSTVQMHPLWVVFWLVIGVGLVVFWLAVFLG